MKSETTMYVYGQQWKSALNKILKRLVDDGIPGMFILCGSDGCGKSDLIKLLTRIVEDAEVAQEWMTATGGLSQLAFARGYVAVSVAKNDLYPPGVPVAVLGQLLDVVCSNGLRPNRRILLAWDDIDRNLHDEGYKAVNYGFLEAMHRPLELYTHMTFVMSMTTKGRQEIPEIPGFSGGPRHFFHL